MAGRIRLGRHGRRLYQRARAEGLSAACALDVARVALAWERAEAAGLLSEYAEPDDFDRDEWAEDAAAVEAAEWAVRYADGEAADAEREAADAEAEAAEARAWTPEALAEAEAWLAEIPAESPEWRFRESEVRALRYLADPETRRALIREAREARRAERSALARLKRAETQLEWARHRLAEWERVECVRAVTRYRVHPDARRWYVADALGGVFVGPRDNLADALGGDFAGYLPDMRRAALDALRAALRARRAARRVHAAHAAAQAEMGDPDALAAALDAPEPRP